MAGRPLAAPHVFSFTTPTVKLTSLRWYRKQNRFDQPVVLALRFNQPVRAADVARLAVVRHEPYEFEAPTLDDAARARLVSLDPAGARRFDAKVATARQVAARRDVVAARAAADWDRERFPASDDLVVLETLTAPAAGARLRVTLPTTLTGAEGPTRPSQPQSSVATLAPMFFATGVSCTEACNPSGYNAFEFTAAVPVAGFATALSVRNISSAATEQPVRPATAVAASALDDSANPGLEDAGYDRQPPATRFAFRLDPTLRATDGQVLGYPWIGIVENWHETAFTSFGDGHGVWEADGGTILPFSSRNFTDVRQWLSRLSLADLVPRLVALEQKNFTALPPGAGTPRRLTITPDATQAHGLDLRSVLSPTGTGLVWAGMRPGEPIARSRRAVGNDNPDRSTIVQVTNLGITVKDSPQSTLVFVTRLDNGQPVAAASVSIINVDNKALWSRGDQRGRHRPGPGAAVAQAR